MNKTKGKGGTMGKETKLVRIIGNKAIYVKGNMIVAVDIDKKALAVLDYYKKIPVNDL